jgi:large subunit ribosomal protein L35
MPKMKTHSSASKRFRVTGTGKVFRQHAFLGHNMRKKTASRKRRLQASVQISRADEGRIDQLLPYHKSN